METLRGLAEHALVKAKGIVSKGEELMPVFIFENADMVNVAGMPHYGRDREFSIFVMKHLIHTSGAFQYVFIMGAWFGAFSASDDPRKKDPNYLPSKDPMRKECVCAIGANRDGESVFLILEIKRDTGSVTFSEPVFPPDGFGLSILDNLFETRKPN